MREDSRKRECKDGDEEGGREPDDIPECSGSACWAQIIELGCGAISIKPAAKRTTPPSTSALTWVK